MGSDNKFVAESKKNIESSKLKIIQQQKQKSGLQNLLEIRTSNLGISAPATLETMKNLICLMKKLGEYSQALDMAHTLLQLLKDSNNFELEKEILEEIKKVSERQTNWGNRVQQSCKHDFCTPSCSNYKIYICFVNYQKNISEFVYHGNFCRAYCLPYF